MPRPSFGGGPIAVNGGEGRVFLAKFDGQGHHVWSRAASGSALQNPFVAPSVDPTGNVIVSGRADAGEIDLGGGPTDVSGTSFVAKLNPMGAHRWTRVVASETLASRTWLIRPVADPSGNVVAAGSFQGSIDFGGPSLNNVQTAPSASSTDMVVAKLAP